MFTSCHSAARIDRLARRAHAFHRFAHHPLCTAYEGEVLRIGRRTRVCRGCTHAAAGALLGASIGFALPPLGPVPIAMGLVAAALLSASSMRCSTVSARRLRRAPAAAGRGRRSKLVTRGVPSALLFVAVAAGARSATLAGVSLAALAVALLAVGVVAYRRRGPDRSTCHTCPELGAPDVCSGFQAIARREAAFSRAAAGILGNRAHPSTLRGQPRPTGTNVR